MAESKNIGINDMTPTESVAGAEVKLAEIKEIMLENGWFDQSALVIKDNFTEKIYLLDGHHRFAVAHEIGLTQIPGLFLEFFELARFHLFYNSIEQIREAAKNVKKFR